MDDWMSLSDPVVALFKEVLPNRYKLMDQTETILDNHDPEFLHQFEITYLPNEIAGERYLLRIYDVDGPEVGEQDFMGSVMFDLEDFIAKLNKDEFLEAKLKNRYNPDLDEDLKAEDTSILIKVKSAKKTFADIDMNQTSVYIKAREVMIEDDPNNPRKVIRKIGGRRSSLIHSTLQQCKFAIRCRNLPAGIKSPFISFFTRNPRTRELKFIGVSEKSASRQNPSFNNIFEVDWDRSISSQIKVSVYDGQREGDKLNQNDRVGHVLVPLRDLMNTVSNSKSHEAVVTIELNKLFDDGSADRPIFIFTRLDGEAAKIDPTISKRDNIINHLKAQMSAGRDFTYLDGSLGKESNVYFRPKSIQLDKLDRICWRDAFTLRGYEDYFYLEDITEIRLGKQHPYFLSSDGAEALSPACCFTVIVGEEGHSFAASTKRMRDTWALGIASMARLGGNSTLVMKADLVPFEITSDYEFVDHNTTNEKSRQASLLRMIEGKQFTAFFPSGTSSFASEELKITYEPTNIKSKIGMFKIEPPLFDIGDTFDLNQLSAIYLGRQRGTFSKMIESSDDNKSVTLKGTEGNLDLTAKYEEDRVDIVTAIQSILELASRYDVPTIPFPKNATDLASDFNLEKCIEYTTIKLKHLVRKEGGDVDKIQKFIVDLKRRYIQLDIHELGYITRTSVRNVVWRTDEANKDLPVSNAEFEPHLQEVVDEMMIGAGDGDSISFWDLVKFLGGWSLPLATKIRPPSADELWAYGSKSN